jgi:hypothetical protein
MSAWERARTARGGVVVAVAARVVMLFGGRWLTVGDGPSALLAGVGDEHSGLGRIAVAYANGITRFLEDLVAHQDYLPKPHHVRWQLL